MLIHEDDKCVAFRDVNPQAPTHLLIVPKKHIEKISDTKPMDTTLLGHLMAMTREVAAKTKLSDYRIVVNNGIEAGQTVWHVHIHLLSGRPFSWPPG